MCKSKSLRMAAALVAVACLFVFCDASGWAASKCGNATVTIKDNFTGNLNRWQMPFPQDWQILQEGNLHYLHMKRNREPGVPRRPLQFALLKGVKVGSFTLNVKTRSIGHSMIVVFNYVDTLHFYYVHLSDNPGRKISVHNGIFIVDGKPRYRIAGLDATPALPDHNWHHVRIVRNVNTGSIKIYMDNETKPRFSVIDRTFTCGQVGLGSFDETGDFASFRLHSNDAQVSAVVK
ncbi:MAG: hypothetical protein ACRD28_11205 [Acidobacteriaceae bacterium]